MTDVKIHFFLLHFFFALFSFLISFLSFFLSFRNFFKKLSFSFFVYFLFIVIFFFLLDTLCQQGWEYTDCIPWKKENSHPKDFGWDMTLNYVWWWCSNSWALRSVENSFVAITPMSTYLEWYNPLGLHLWVKFKNYLIWQDCVQKQKNKPSEKQIHKKKNGNMKV